MAGGHGHVDIGLLHVACSCAGGGGGGVTLVFEWRGVDRTLNLYQITFSCILQPYSNSKDTKNPYTILDSPSVNP